MAENFYCEYCGSKASSVASLVSGYCGKNPTKKHVLYEGSEKAQYTCKYCGNKASSLASLVSGYCGKNPTKKHQPMR